MRVVLFGQVLISTFFLFAVAQGQSPLPKNKIPPAKIVPPSPKAGELAVISTEAADPIFDIDSLPAKSYRQFGKELAISVPDSKEAKTYSLRILFIADGKIQIEKIDLKVAGSDPAPKPPTPGPEDQDAIKSLRADLVNGFNRIDANLASLSARVAALEGPRPPPPVPPVPDVAPIPHPGFRVLMIYDSAATMPPAQTSVLTSQLIRQYLNGKCVVGPDGKTAEWRVWSFGADASGESKLWQDAFKRKPGKEKMPWLIVSSGNSGFEGPLPATVEETLKLLKKYGGE